MTKPVISVVIPAKNSGEKFAECLRGILSQEDEGIEIVVVDSGSLDDTVRTAKSFGASVISIPPASFTHGYARNLGASKAQGETIVFCNSDVIPVNDQWLRLLLKPLSDARVAATFSRQIPPSGAQFHEKVFLRKVYPDAGFVHTARDLTPGGQHHFVLYSTVASAIRANVWKKFRFNEALIMCEDIELATRLLKSGWQVEYCPESLVYHANEYTLLSAFRRYFDAGWAASEISRLDGASPNSSPGWFVEVLRSALGDPEEPTFGRAAAMAYLFSKALGFEVGRLAPNLPSPLRKKVSHTEAQRRSR